MKRTFEQEINEKGHLVYNNVGVSMYPLIRQYRDLLVIEKPKFPCKKYDIVLFKRGDKYILHRIIEVGNKSYSISGDNCISIEHNVKESQIIGVLKEIVRDGKKIPIDSKKYKISINLICKIFILRYFLLAARRIKWKIKGKLTQKQ